VTSARRGITCQFGEEGKPDAVIPRISQESLAEMVGSTRSRVSFFMNRFRKMRFVAYDGNGMQVHSSLLNVVLHDGRLRLKSLHENQKSKILLRLAILLAKSKNRTTIP
jgi:hypothetical protein